MDSRLGVFGRVDSYGTGRFNGWRDFFKRFGRSPIELNQEQGGSSGLRNNAITIDGLYKVFKERMLEEAIESEKAIVD